MARIETVITECDMPHENDKSPAQPFTFIGKSIGEYTIDLCQTCADMLLGPVTAHGQRTIKRRQRRSE